MKLAIADPPYPPNLLAAGRLTGHGPPLRATRWYAGKSTRGHTHADNHPDAAEWNRPERHRELLAELDSTYDGWCIATAPDAVAAVYPPLPYGVRVMVWARTNAPPSAHRVRSSWEAVLVKTPLGRHRAGARGDSQVPDVLVSSAPRRSFAGAKPEVWTHWVLAAMGYDPDTDTVTDLFPGSGAVGHAVATYGRLF